MIRCLKTKKENGEKLRVFLTRKRWIDDSRIIGRTTRELVFPLNDSAKISELKKYGSIVERSLPRTKAQKVRTLREALKGVIPPSKIEEMNNAMDVVGDIAVLEIPDSVINLEKSIAWTVKRMMPKIKVVAKKDKKTKGKYRIRKISPLVGEKRTKTIARESGMSLLIDLNKAYYSSRMGAERIRILKQIRKGEKILIMFAGIGPYPILFSKYKNVRCWANEWNPAAVKFMEENIRMNRVRDKVVMIPGDAHKVVPELKEKFDRICMILPSATHEFVKEVLAVSKKGTVIHFYQFVHEKEFQKRGKEIVKLFGNKVKVRKINKSGYYAPYVYRVCYDLKVN